MLNNLLGKCLWRFVLPLLPGTWQLPFSYFLHIKWFNTDQELKYLQHLAKADGLAIDVGCNQGLYSYKMSKTFREIWAFEVNDAVTKPLRLWASKKVRMFPFGLSSHNGEAVLHIPIVKGVEWSGWGSLVKGEGPPGAEYVEKRVSVRRLDDLQPKDVCFIKIDVEGHELSVLEGAVQTIRKDRPVLLIEIHEGKRNPVVEFLRQYEYMETNLQNLSGGVGSSEMIIFFPV